MGGLECMFEYQKPVSVTERFSLYNTGSSFNDKSYTMETMRDVEVFYNIENDGMTDASVLPSKDDDITVKIAKIYLGQEKCYGYYVQYILINPNYGRSFIRFLNNEPFIHYLCDKFMFSEGKLNSINIPDVALKSMRPINPSSEMFIEDYPEVLRPASKIHFLLKEETLEAYSGNKKTLFKYRNFDFYKFNDKWLDGSIAVQTKYVAIIENYFDKICYHYSIRNYTSSLLATRKNVLDVPTRFRDKVQVMSPKTLYSEETYELKTVAALSIGKAMQREDLINDLMGRVYVQPITQKMKETFTTEILHMYGDYINSVGHHLAVVSHFRPEVALHDCTYSATEAVAGKYLQNFISTSFRCERKTVYDSNMYNFRNLYKQRSYFKPLSEQINLLREAAVNFLPTEVVSYEHVSPYYDSWPDLARESEEIMNGKIFYININSEPYFNFYILGNQTLLVPEIKKKILKSLKVNRNFIPNQYNMLSQSLPVGTIESRARKEIKLDLEEKKDGDSIITLPCKNMPVLQLSLDLSKLKQLFFSELKVTKDGNIYLQPFILLDNELTIGQSECEWYLPDSWRKYQEADNTYMSLVKRQLNSSIQFKSDYVTILKRNEENLDCTDPLAGVEAFKSFTVSNAKSSNHRTYYCYDPAYYIREGMKAEKSKNVTNVKSFEGRSDSKGVLNYKETYPINTYTTISSYKSHDLVVPMFGVFASISSDDIPSLSIDTLQEALAQKSIIFNITEGRRY